MIPSVTPRARLIRAAFRLEWFTLAWMVVEAAVALASGVIARSISLIAFGVDSLIELASACVLIWRLNVELRHGQSVAERAERTASRIGGALLFALAAYIVVAAGGRLWTRQGADFSWPGLLVSLAAIPIMWLLSRRKLQISEALGSRALRTDAVESITCGWRLRRADRTVGTAGTRRVVGRHRDLARDRVAASQRRPRGLARGGNRRLRA